MGLALMEEEVSAMSSFEIRPTDTGPEALVVHQGQARAIEISAEVLRDMYESRLTAKQVMRAISAYSNDRNPQILARQSDPTLASFVDLFQVCYDGVLLSVCQAAFLRRPRIFSFWVIETPPTGGGAQVSVGLGDIVLDDDLLPAAAAAQPIWVVLPARGPDVLPEIYPIVAMLRDVLGGRLKRNVALLARRLTLHADDRAQLTILRFARAAPDVPVMKLFDDVGAAADGRTAIEVAALAVDGRETTSLADGLRRMGLFSGFDDASLDPTAVAKMLAFRRDRTLVGIDAIESVDAADAMAVISAAFIHLRDGGLNLIGVRWRQTVAGLTAPGSDSSSSTENEGPKTVSILALLKRPAT